jgi:hypothetical protein
VLYTKRAIVEDYYTPRNCYALGERVLWLSIRSECAKQCNALSFSVMRQCCTLSKCCEYTL